MNEVKKIICRKCQDPMKKDSLSLPKSIDTFSGTHNITDRSDCVCEPKSLNNGTTTFTTSTGTGQKESDALIQKNTIKIRNYTCPACGWKKQVREQ